MTRHYYLILFIFSLLVFVPVSATATDTEAAAQLRSKVETIAKKAASDADALVQLFEDAALSKGDKAIPRLEAILIATGQVPLSIQKEKDGTVLVAQVQLRGINIPVSLPVPTGVSIGKPNDLRFGVPMHKGIVFSDRGFRAELQDGSNQVGHFLIATRLGYDQAFITNPIVQSLLSGTGSPDDSIRIMLGHEQVRQEGGGRFGAIDPFAQYAKELRSPTDEEVAAFRKGALSEIRVGAGSDQSQQDVRLSYLGWQFGSAIREGKIKTRSAAAAWLRENLLPPIPS